MVIPAFDIILGSGIETIRMGDDPQNFQGGTQVRHLRKLFVHRDGET